MESYYNYKHELKHLPLHQKTQQQQESSAADGSPPKSGHTPTTMTSATSSSTTATCRSHPIMTDRDDGNVSCTSSSIPDDDDLGEQRNRKVRVGIESIREHDFIGGRNRHLSATNPGNLWFLKKIEKYKNIFRDAETRSERTKIVLLVFDEIKSEGGRFLVWPYGTNSPYIADRVYGLTKIGTSFRKLLYQGHFNVTHASSASSSNRDNDDVGKQRHRKVRVGIESIREHDFIGGRNSYSSAANPGNLWFLRKIEKYKNIYREAETRSERKKIELLVFDEIKSEGGRFLVWPNTTDSLYIADRVYGLTKIGKSFRKLLDQEHLNFTHASCTSSSSSDDDDVGKQRNRKVRVGIESIREHDFIGGRNSYTLTTNPGNLWFQTKIEKYKNIFRDAETRWERTKIVSLVLDEIESEGGRFLVWPNVTDSLHIADREYGRRKIVRSFRKLLTHASSASSSNRDNDDVGKQRNRKVGVGIPKSAHAATTTTSATSSRTTATTRSHPIMMDKDDGNAPCTSSSSPDDELLALDAEEIAKWESMYQSIVEYKKKHGHTNVFSRDLKHGKLFDWIEDQRRCYKTGLILPERLEKLNEIGFEWKLREARTPSYIYEEWKRKWEQLRYFHQIYGHFDGNDRYRELQLWVKRQRETAWMVPQLKDMLDSINFEWIPHSSNEEKKDWNAKYKRYIKYMKALKCRGWKSPPGSCIASSGIASNDLKRWMYQQRFLKHQKNGLNDARIALLEASSFSWELPHRGSASPEEFNQLMLYKFHELNQDEQTEKQKDDENDEMSTDTEVSTSSKKNATTCAKSSSLQLHGAKKRSTEQYGVADTRKTEKTATTNQDNNDLPALDKRVSEKEQQQRMQHLYHPQQMQLKYHHLQQIEEQREHQIMQHQHYHQQQAVAPTQPMEGATAAAAAAAATIPQPQMLVQPSPSMLVPPHIVPHELATTTTMPMMMPMMPLMSQQAIPLQIQRQQRPPFITKEGLMANLSKGEEENEAWMFMYQELLRYKKKYGHCYAKNPYSSRNAVDDDIELGTWVDQQRYLNNIPNGLPVERFALLNAAGFSWHVPGSNPSSTFGDVVLEHDNDDDDTDDDNDDDDYNHHTDHHYAVHHCGNQQGNQDCNDLNVTPNVTTTLKKKTKSTLKKKTKTTTTKERKTAPMPVLVARQQLETMEDYGGRDTTTNGTGGSTADHDSDICEEFDETAVATFGDSENWI